MVKVKILGLSASPIQNGNSDKLVQFALKACEELGDVETEFISTADKKIQVCDHCQWCIENRAPCKIRDDVHEVLASIERCDGLMLGSPTWLNTLSPFLVNIFSRARYQVFFTNKFRNRVVGLLTLGFLGFGMERALDTMRNIVSCFYMIPVGEGSALGSARAYGKRPTYLEHGVLDDEWGMFRAQAVATRVVEVSRMLKYAGEAAVGLNEDQKRPITGSKPKPADQKVFVDGVWRDKEE